MNSESTKGCAEKDIPTRDFWGVKVPTSTTRRKYPGGPGEATIYIDGRAWNQEDAIRICKMLAASAC